MKVGIVDIRDGVSDAEASLSARALRERQRKPAQESHRRPAKVLQRIWHTADERYYEPGEVVDVSHLSLDALQVLLDSGIISLEVEDGVHDESE